MNRRTTVIIIAVSVVALAVLVAIGVGVAVLLSEEGTIGGGGKVALIRIEGVITSGRGSSGLFGEGGAGAERIVDLLEEFRRDDSVKSLVLRINSPGGSAAGSQEVYQEIVKVRRDGKKVTVSMGDVAASGGYYIASAADRIITNPATVTGSIGVIMEAADMHELLGNVGIGFNTIKSGKHKDMGSFSRAMTPEERKILQAVIDDVYDQFITDVSKGRKLPKEEVRKLADGRVYTGRQAVKLKLVDRTGSLEDALRAAATDAGITGEFRITEYKKEHGLIDILFGPTDTKLSLGLGDDSPLLDLARGLLRTDSHVELR